MTIAGCLWFEYDEKHKYYDYNYNFINKTKRT